MKLFPIYGELQRADYSSHRQWQRAKVKRNKASQLYVGPQADVKASALFRTHQIKTAVVLLESLRLVEQDYDQLEVDCIHFPIPDFQPPESVELVQRLAEKVQEALKSGNVFMHCMGGKGRTGTIAACLKITFDPTVKTAQEAITLTRGIIPGAIETPKQEEFIQNYFNFIRLQEEPPDSWTKLNMTDFFNYTDTF
jgi:protein-tyrosine phosphatase